MNLAGRLTLERLGGRRCQCGRGRPVKGEQDKPSIDSQVETLKLKELLDAGVSLRRN